MSQIKVLHVIARMNIGGTARYVGDLVGNISSSALATGYVQDGEIEDLVVSSLPVHRLSHMGRKISPLNDFKACLELRKLIKELNPQIVHTHTFKAGLIGRLIKGKHKRVHSFHGHLFGDQSFSSMEKDLITSVEKYLARRTDFLISVGEKVGIELRSSGIGKQQNWMSIPPGVDPLPTTEKIGAREKLGLKREGVLIGWMARMAEVKNPFLLLDIARELPNVNFVMAGGGKLLPAVVTSAPPNISVIGWVDSATFWSAVDCAVSTSDNEGMPIALIEAQLAGIPVVTTDVGSSSEVVVNDLTGFVTAKNRLQLIEAIRVLVEDSAQRESMGKSAKIWARENFSKDECTAKHEIIYDQILLN